MELKAPGKGADPCKFKGDDKNQWEGFKNLPNLIYTDGNEWALYRSGERVGKMVRLSGDVTSEGQAAISPADAEAILALMQDFLRWEPIVPVSPTALAKMLAPLCRLLRADVLTALHNRESNLSLLAADWRKYLFPDADDYQFADAYAQTLTYALLLARLSGPGAGLSIPQAAAAIRTGHRLLADALGILGDPKAREEIETPVSVLERVIGAVDPAALTKKAKGDPWLYFYEDFLAAYDPKMRRDRGVYYTPVEVVQAQVKLVAQLLEERFDANYAFVNDKVITLDPGAGTGTYILAALQHGLDRVEQEKGPGKRSNFATQAARNLHAFDLLVGAYAVAHLRLTQQILAERGQMPPDGVHVYLTDTLESPRQPVTAADLFVYCYAVLASPDYVHRFWDELTIPGPRLPLTRDAARFARVTDVGCRLLWLHTYGDRLAPPEHKPGRIPPGKAKCLRGTPAAPEKYPEKFSYDLAGGQLHVGEGVFGPVRPEVWEFSVSGFQVVQHWLAHRMQKGAGKKSSPLDKIRPAAWQFDEELLDLLWVMEHTVDLWPELSKALREIVASDLFTAQDFPEPKAEERMAKEHLPLFGAADTNEASTDKDD
jgi:hypothetical protein